VSKGQTVLEQTVRKRVGVNAMEHDVLQRADSRLPIGWYRDYLFFGGPVAHNDAQIEYVATLPYQGRYRNTVWKRALTPVLMWLLWITRKLPRPPGRTFADGLDSLSLQRLRQRIERQPEILPAGTLFMVGNEPGCASSEDSRSPEQIVADARVLKDVLDSFDRGYRLGLGGISTPRNKWAKDAYGEGYGIGFLRRILDCLDDFKFDALSVHPYSDDPAHPSAENSQQHIIEFRQVLNEYGLRDRELLVGEIGVPFTASNEKDRLQFTREILPFLLTARDDTTGKPDDDNRLVQRFAWFSLHAPTFPIPGQTDNPGLDFPASALVTADGQLTTIGQVFVETVKDATATT